MVKKYFVTSDSKSQKQIRDNILLLLQQLNHSHWSNERAYYDLEKLSEYQIPEKGKSLNTILNQLEPLIRGSLNLSNKFTNAHMHAVPTSASIIGKFLESILNQSQDAWDESPYATYVETSLSKEISKLFYNDSNADGIFDSGGTMSNQSAIIIARDKFLYDLGIDVKKSGLGNYASKLRVFASEQAHFSIDKAVHICGLGTDSIIKIKVNKDLVLDPNDLEKKIKEEKNKGYLPFVVVATAGTTNAGNFPDLKAINEIAKKENMWLHVDAAYGGGFIFSQKYKHLLKGIEKADSITFDPHKLLYQPFNCGFFILKDESNFRFLTHHSEYLNPENDENINLVDKSLMTSRAFSALSLYLSLENLGMKGYDNLITTTTDRAQTFARMIKNDNQLELLVEPHSNIVLFRYLCENPNEVNKKIQETLYKEGFILSRTTMDENFYIKATCMNPSTTINDYKIILSKVKEKGNKFSI